MLNTYSANVHYADISESIASASNDNIANTHKIVLAYEIFSRKL